MLQEKQALFPSLGFSLLELILTLVIGGILGVIIFTLTRTHPLSSVDPLLSLKENSSLIEAIEEVNAYYRNLIEKNLLTDLNSFEQEARSIIANIDPNIKVVSKFILFNSENKEIDDNQNIKRFLKLILTKDNLRIFNLYTK